MLFRLSMVRAGPTEPSRDTRLLGSLATPLSWEGRRQVASLTRHWEWVEALLASPLRRARETAAVLARGRRVVLEPGLEPRRLGRWEGRSPEALHAADPDGHAHWRAGEAAFELSGAEPSERFGARVEALLERLLARPERSLLVVSHLCVIRAIAHRVGAPLPPGRPWPAEMVLLTRRADGRFALGRRSSDPEPLRAPLERDGLSGRPEERPPERHVERLTFAH